MGFSYYIDIIIGVKFSFEDIKEEYKDKLEEEDESQELNYEIEDILGDRIKCTKHKTTELDNIKHIYYEKDCFCITIKGLKHLDCENMNDENSEKAKSWSSSGGYIKGINIDYEKLSLSDEEKKLIDDAVFELTGKKLPINLHVFTDGG